ncbi:MAG: chromosome segregation protein SMC [candidate division WOR-3 bacterium]
MRLKEIRLSGFKSFPSKTCLSLKEGVTSFVGPNGCGKSNIIDAIRWSLGETSTKALRAEGMEDLIFSGTEKRPPVGMAEVTLIFENNGGIPTEFDEVEIKRRFFRSGESEFLINGTPCQLRDIRNLFANTGLKSAILSQGSVEDFLIADSEIRREIFESISGIKKYRNDKKEAENKLIGVSAALEKLEIILNERRSSVNSLKIEANRARRFHKYKEKLKEKTIILAKKQLFEMERILEEREKVKKEQEERIDLIQSIINKLMSEIKIEEEVLKEKREEYRLKGDLIQRVQEEISILREKKAANSGELRHIENYTKDFPNNISDVILDLQNELEEVKQKENKLDYQILNYKQIIEHLEKKYKELNSLIEGLKERELSLKIRREEQISRMNLLNRVVEECKGEIEREISKMRELKTSIESKRERLKESSEKINKLNEMFNKLENEKTILLRRIQEERAEIERIKREIEFYKKIDIEVSDEIKKISKEFNLPFLSDDLEVEKGYESAIEAILGEKVKGLVVKVEEIKEILNFIRDRDLRGGVFVTEEGKEEKGGMAEVIFGRFANLLKKELSKYKFTETLGEAIEKAKKEGGYWVTRRGELVIDNFIILPKDKEGVLERRAKEKFLFKKKEEKEARLKILEEERTEILDKLNQIEKEMEKEKNKREELVNSVSKIEFEISRLEVRLESITANLANTQKDLDNIKKTLKEEEEEKKNIEGKLSLNFDEQEKIKKEIEIKEGELKKLEEERREIEEKERRLREEMGRLKEGLRLLQKKEELKKEIQELDVIIEKKTKEFEDQKKGNVSLNSEIQKREEVLIEKRKELLKEEEEKSKLESQLNELKMKIAEERYKKEGLQNQIFKEFGVEVTPEKVEVNEEEFSKEIEILKKRIEALYPVNPLAMIQYEEKLRELEKLERERADLVASKKDIEETILEIDAKAKKEFEETINKIKEDFKSIYSKLSPGGEADIRLKDGNVFESDIEILVRPKGKKLKNMELFSTGEKTIAAIALLLSVMRKLRSPIYIMDEIDASLDESNIERFNDVLREFAEDSQILIVTHNRATMERSDYIYGITMEEEGVSKVLSISVNEI